MISTRRRLLRAVGVFALGSLAGCNDTLRDRSLKAPSVNGWPSVHYDGHNTNHNPHADPPTDEPKVAWRIEGHSWNSAPAKTTYRLSNATPVIAGERVYVGGQGVTCYDTRTGEQVWKRENGNRFVVGLAVLHGRVHAVERASDRSTSGDPKGFLSVVDAATGERTRTVRCGARTFAPTTDGDLIVVPTRRGQIGFDSAGNRQWRVADGTPRIPPGPAAITDDSVYLSASGEFGRYSRRSDPITGTTVDSRWSVDSGLRRRWHPPTVTDECIVAPLVQLAQDLPETGGVRPGLHAYGRDGRRRWHLPVPTAWMSSDDHRGQFIHRVSSPAVADGVGYVTSARLSLEGGTVTSTDTTLQAFDTTSGDERWRATFPGEGSDAVSPVVADGRVYAVVPDSGTRGGETSRLVAYGRRGDRSWSVDVPGIGYHLAVSGETVYVALRGDKIVAYRSR